MEEEIVKSSSPFDKAVELSKLLLAEIEKAVVGKHNEATLLICALLSGSHILVEDVPGVGKTTLATALSKSAGLSFKRAQFTPDIMASDITGFNIYNRQTESFEFREGLVMSNLLLADEINRASPKTQSALLEAMEESKVTVDGTTYSLPEPFMVMATQNPHGFVGTYPLPEAQLDRFALKISMGYPTLEQELNIISSRKTQNPLSTLSAITTVNDIVNLQKITNDILIDDEICKYIVEIVSATRKHPLVSLGASPRASISLMRISRAYAFMKGRNYVQPDDVNAVCKNVLCHRLMLSQEAKISRTTPESVISDILLKTDVPFKGSKSK